MADSDAGTTVPVTLERGYRGSGPSPYRLKEDPAEEHAISGHTSRTDLKVKT